MDQLKFILKNINYSIPGKFQGTSILISFILFGANCSSEESGQYEQVAIDSLHIQINPAVEIDSVLYKINHDVNNSKEIFSQTNESIQNKEVKVVFSEIKSFNLDEETAFYTTCLQYANISNTDVLCLINELNNSIYVYDYRSGTLLKKIPLQSDGPNGTGRQVRSFYFHNWDSIFVMSDWTLQITLIDSSSRKINSYPARNPTSQRAVYPYGSTVRPLLYINNKLIFAGFYQYYLKSEKRERALVVVDPHTKTIDGMFSYPNSNFQALYGRNGGYMDYTFNADENLIVLSQMVSDSIHVGNLASGKSNKYFAKSKYIKTIAPLDKNIFADIDKEKWRKYDVEGQCYVGIIYDMKNKVYYRFAYDNTKDYLNPDNYIIVLNNKFEIIGHHPLPKGMFMTTMFFANNDGVYLARKDLYKNDEETLSFQRIDLQY